MSRRYEIRREVALPATPEQVWRAIATRQGQAGWFMTMDDDAGTKIESDPPHRMEVRYGPEATEAIEYLIEARGDGTAVLRFVHSGMLSDDWGDEFEAMTGHGWDLYLFTLGEYLRHFPDRPAAYAEAEAPHVDGAWERVLAAFGDPADGARVDAAGVSGVVDRRTEHHFGIRTADAFVRFHERSPIGMPVAVGHHSFSPDADPTALSAAWAGWLAATLDPEGRHDHA